jgi:hypothetical protein
VDRRADKSVLSLQDLADLQRKLATMSITGLQDFYRAAYYRCRLESAGIPAARATQELVQAWKALRKG